jgi:hypothetical protein
MSPEIKRYDTFSPSDALWLACAESAKKNNFDGEKMQRFKEVLQLQIDIKGDDTHEGVARLNEIYHELVYEGYLKPFDGSLTEKSLSKEGLVSLFNT